MSTLNVSFCSDEESIGRNPLLRLIEFFRCKSEISRTRRELSRLSDRELSDIGLNRCQVHAILEGKFVA